MHWRDFAKSIGVSSATIKALAQDDLPEDFDLNKVAEEYIEKRKKLVLNDPEVRKSIKKATNDELYPTIMKSIVKELKSTFGISAADIEASIKEGEKYADPKALIALAAEKSAAQGNKNADEVKKELFDLKAQYNDALAKHNDDIEKLKLSFDDERKNNKLLNHFSKEIEQSEWIVPIESAKMLLSTTVTSEGYKMDFDDKGNFTILNADGRKIDNGNDFVPTSELIKQLGDKLGIRKKSNGGAPIPPAVSGAGTPPAAGGSGAANKSQHLQDLERRIAEANKK